MSVITKERTASRSKPWTRKRKPESRTTGKSKSNSTRKPPDSSAISKESRARTRSKPKGDVSGIAKALSGFMKPNSPSLDQPTRASKASRENPATDSGGESDPVRFGTYNIAGGNSEHRGRTADEISPHLANQVTSGEADVVALQEVKIFPEDGGEDGDLPRVDTNEEILMDTFRAEVGPDWSEADIEKVSLDHEGRPVTEDGEPVYDPNRFPDTRYEATLEDGTSEEMVVSRQSLDEDGEPLTDEAGNPVYDRDAPTTEFATTTPDGEVRSAALHKQSFHSDGRPMDEYDSDRSTPVQVYDLEIDNDKTYTQVFGTSTDHGYGNAVLLGPNASLNRNSDGSIEVDRLQLGEDPDGEKRTAISVGFTTRDGQESTALSTHFSNGSSGAQEAARVDQYKELYDYTNDLDSVIVGGDFNSVPGGGYFDAQLALESPWRDYPNPESGGLERSDNRGDIDHILVGGDAGAAEGDNQQGGKGGSDHELELTEISLG
jgi:endonuclease/exonuclease/phosphatase family metal-dependent hydrolase